MALFGEEGVYDWGTIAYQVNVLKSPHFKTIDSTGHFSTLDLTQTFE